MGSSTLVQFEDDSSRPHPTAYLILYAIVRLSTLWGSAKSADIRQ